MIFCRRCGQIRTTNIRYKNLHMCMHYKQRESWSSVVQSLGAGCKSSFRCRLRIRSRTGTSPPLSRIPDMRAYFLTDSRHARRWRGPPNSWASCERHWPDTTASQKHRLHAGNWPKYKTLFSSHQNIRFVTLKVRVQRPSCIQWTTNVSTQFNRNHSVLIYNLS
jgi:hypothetical protein